ncbi:branched-chain amino acid aminotransferase [Gluconacetobacter diazotrophicus]|uniref:Branched-chain-amino-acid aminotransferase n=1 Tax=Gluconacetobacter diazotrophicus TaxID=33996 RepID=A0A7W4FDI6_GLUDI|nr:branched-chain amino acid aminotransferase [Gluconacetobacter diazotrophicus]MBB2155709.1 branched-chain amino acid aminotransferase [Gluconacetobacter diazotrophicus]
MDSADQFRFTHLPHPAPVPAARRTELLANPGFGRVFTDHMAVVRYKEGQGWHNPTIEARAPIPLDPAAAVLHYAQEIFEGMKAYRAADGGVVMFRPDANARRFYQSAERMAMAPVPDALFLAAVRELVRADRDWIPTGENASLYLRPFMIASEAFLGVKPSSEYLFIVIASPVGSYFSGGAVSVWVSEDYTRAAVGGTGAAKCGGNYAASLLAQREAKTHGCDQVLFLDAVEHRWVEEMGGMNIFFVLDDGSLVTPPLGGTILPGITRDAILTLARDRGLTVREEPYSIDQCYADAASGRLKEAFACGTAAVVTPIGRLCGHRGEVVIGSGNGADPVTESLRGALIGIQRGQNPDPYGWVQHVA